MDCVATYILKEWFIWLFFSEKYTVSEEDSKKKKKVVIAFWFAPNCIVLIFINL